MNTAGQSTALGCVRVKLGILNRTVVHYADVPPDRIYRHDVLNRRVVDLPVTTMCGAAHGRHGHNGLPPMIVVESGGLTCPKCIKIARREPVDAVDAAARSILAARAEQAVEDWHLVRAVADPADVEAVQARLAEYAQMIRAGALTAVSRG